MRGNLSPELGYIDIRVDRASVLGNPFELTNEEDRDKVCDAYVDWLWLNLVFVDSKTIKSIKLDSFISKRKLIISKTFKNPACFEVSREISRLINLLLDNKQLRLICWCSPKRCHAEAIKNVLTEKYYQVKEHYE